MEVYKHDSETSNKTWHALQNHTMQYYDKAKDVISIAFLGMHIHKRIYLSMLGRVAIFTKIQE